MGSNTQEIISFLQRERIDFLYHFTCIENLPGISRHGALCSKAILESCGEWPVSNPGGNSWSHDQDRRNDNWDKIALSFIPQTQMFYNRKSEKHFCFFVISLEVAGWTDVLFTDTNSASVNHNRATGLEGLNLIDFEMVRAPYLPTQHWGIYHQAEVLIPQRIPMEFVSKIVFISEASMDLGERFWESGEHPDFDIDIPLFQSQPDPTELTVSFPYVSEIRLTDTLVTRQNYRNLESSLTKFKREEAALITAIVKLNSFAGLKCKIKWFTNGPEHEYEVEKPGNRIWVPHIALDALPDGSNILEVRLNDILWAAVEYEVIS